MNTNIENSLSLKRAPIGAGIRINTPMMRRKVHRLIAGRFVELSALSSKQWVVSSGGKRHVRPAIHLSGVMEKVKRLCNTRDREAEMSLLNGGLIEDAPTLAYLIKNVELVGAHIYAKAGRLQPGYGREELVLKNYPPKQRLQRATLVSNNSGSHYFGNFLWDDLPLTLLDEHLDTHISLVKKAYEHEPGYRELLSVPAARLIRLASIGELTMFSDFAQNESKETRIRTLRARLRAQMPGIRATAPGIFIRRGQTGERRVMTNETQIEQFLAMQGFTIIDPTVLTARQIVEKTLEAKIVVGVEGSHMAHALYSMADDATFLILQPPNRFSLVHKEFADRLGMRYALLVGDPSPGGFSVDVGELTAVLDLL